MDEFTRKVERASKKSEAVLAELAQRPAEELFAALAAAADPESRALEDSSVTDRDQMTRSSAPLLFEVRVNRDLLTRGDIGLGQRIFQRWNAVLHDFICRNDKADRDLRNKVLGAIAGKGGGGVALVAALLVSSFGMGPATAALVAALLIKLVVAPAADEVCRAWGESIGAEQTPPARKPRKPVKKAAAAKKAARKKDK